jgi:DNA-binding LytR/AlgR family response regulator
MATQYNPVFLRDYTAAQQIRMSLADSKGIHLTPINRIVYLQASAPYTNFYITGKNQSDTLQLIVVSRNLGSYTLLFKHGFARANKSFIINSMYLEHLGPDNEIVLSYQHPHISITPDYLLPFKAILGLPCKSKALPAPNLKP